MARPIKRYVVWTDYGTEGWIPDEFDSKDQVEAFILGQTHAGQLVVTELLDVRIVLKDPTP